MVKELNIILRDKFKTWDGIIKKIPVMFAKHTYDNVITLELINNELETIILPQSRLKSFRLYNNQKPISVEFSFSSELKIIELHNNYLKSVIIPPLPELQSLSIKYNKLDCLELPKLPKLAHLYLNQNTGRIKLSQYPKLKYMNIYNTKVGIIPIMPNLSSLIATPNSFDGEINLPILADISVLDISDYDYQVKYMKDIKSLKYQLEKLMELCIALYPLNLPIYIILNIFNEITYLSMYVISRDKLYEYQLTEKIKLIDNIKNRPT